MRKTWLMLAMLAPAALFSFASARAEDDARARKMMEDAFNRRYRWSEGFKGFTADFVFTREGKSVKGTLKADTTRPRGGITVECEDADVKKLVSETVGSTVGHSRASQFDRAFGSCSFSIAGEGTHGGTKIAIEGHGFFKDFTVKDGNIIENHGGGEGMSTEVSVHEVVWMAESGKTLPHAYAFKIKHGDREQTGKNVENWREIDGVWLPTRWHLTRKEESAAAVHSTLVLEDVKLN